jgi:hypothetical protein
MAAEDYAPFNGSWVSELEDAKAELAAAVRTPAAPGGAAATGQTRRGELLQLHLRLCRAYSTLRQWDPLQEEAYKGLKVCAAFKGKGGGAGAEAASRIAEWKARFASYREQAQKEKSLPSYLNQARGEHQLRQALARAAERPGVGGAAVIGDIRLMEALVAHGAGIDKPVPVGRFPGEPLRWAPTNATPLLVVCVDIAAHDAENTEYDGNPTEEFLRMLGNEVDKATECAMQLVRLGADLTRTLNLGKSPNREEASAYRAAGF